jgi:hypothetical protein
MSEVVSEVPTTTDTMGALPIVGWPAYDKTTQRIEPAEGHEVDGEWVTWQRWYEVEEAA